MDKLTINELKGYLGTGLKCKNGNSILELCASYLLIDDNFKEEFISICEITNGGKYWIKPLLYPLSSLTEYREDLGFVPMDNIKESQRHLFFREDLENQINGLDYSEMQKLLSWHFDCFNLIDRKLAINIKTLKDE
jgi:hypothetical protein